MSTIAQLIELEEGYRSHVYYCSEGYPTIAIGKKIGRKGDPLECYNFSVSKSIAMQWVDEELYQLDRKVGHNFPWFDELDQPRADIILSMCYQIGFSGFSKFNKFIAYMEKSEFEQASKEMLDSRWAKQTSKRALRHSEVIKCGDYKAVEYYKSIEV